jgi:hypothetical protein
MHWSTGKGSRWPIAQKRPKADAQSALDNPFDSF